MRLSSSAGKFLVAQMKSFLVQGWFPTGLGSFLTTQLTLGGWLRSTALTYVSRALFTLASNSLVAEAIRSNLRPALYHKLPPTERAKINQIVGSPNGIESISISPNSNQILWRGISGTLKPEQEITTLRGALRDQGAGNAIGASRDIVSALRALRKYGTVKINGHPFSR